MATCWFPDFNISLCLFTASLLDLYMSLTDKHRSLRATTIMGSVVEPRPDAAGPFNPEIKTEIKIEPKIEPKEEPYIKEEPQDDWPMIISETSRPLKPPKPKKEEDEGPKLDNVLPVPGDMFEDVDGEDDVEYVDHTFEGIAHVNGVRHFVCEGSWLARFERRLEFTIWKASKFDRFLNHWW